MLTLALLLLMGDVAPAPREVVPTVMIPNDIAHGGRIAVRLGAVKGEPISVMIPDDGAIRALKVQGIDVDPANPPLRKVYLGAITGDAPNVGKLGDFIAPARAPPAAVDYSRAAAESTKRMYCNDQKGCCVIASLYHGIGVVSAAHGPKCIVVPDSTVLALYAKWAYKPGTDSGCIISDVLAKQRDIGVPLTEGVTRSDGFVTVDNTNKTLVQQWIWLFGGGPIGINLPTAWTAGGDGSVWDVPTNAAVVGAHDVRVVGYNVQGVIVLTWAGIRVITWRAFLKRPVGQNDWGVTECYAVLHPQWYVGDNLAPNGVDIVGLRKSLATGR